MNNEIKNAFDAIHAEESLKQSTKDYLSNKMQKSSNKSVAPRRRLAAVVASVMLIVVAFGGLQAYFTPVSAVSIDVNPSVEMSINRFDRIISVNEYGDNGKGSAMCADMKFKSYTDALEVLMSCSEMKGYLACGEEVSITVTGDSQEKSEEMLSRISSCKYAKSENVRCSGINREQADAAHEAGLSFGKYRAYLELHELDNSVTTNDIKEMTMRQIRERIVDLSGYDDGAAIGDEGFGSGDGKGYQKGECRGK